MTELLLTACIFLAAVLYSAVGNAGASGYMAVLALFAVPADEMRPAALILNILVATIASVRFYRAGCFSWAIFWPFAVSSIPLAFVAGHFRVPASLFNPLVGCVLLVAACGLFRTPRAGVAKVASTWLAMLCGAGIGLLSGLTGTGGGIFLSPLLLFMGWANPQQTASVTAAFVLVNSLAGIGGLLSLDPHLPGQLTYWVIAAAVGACVGSELGSRRLSSPLLRRILSAVLIIAAGKLLFAH
jgi:uncharacterized membrane protein YfcA